MIEIRGECVVLKALEREHCRVLWEQEEVNVEMPTGAFLPGLAKENADKWFDDIQAKQGNSGVDFGVFDLEGNVIGHIQIHSINWQARSGEIGLGFAKTAERGKGHGTDVTRLVVRYAFGHLGLHRLMADPVEYNKAGIRVLEKCGFKQEGCARDAFYFGGRWHNRLIYSILEQEFRGASTASQPVDVCIPRTSGTSRTSGTMPEG